MSSDNFPCVILGYSRIESLKNLVIQADKLGFNPIYVSIDGPSGPEIATIQDNIMRELEKIKETSFSRIILKVNSANLGVAGGVVSGIDWFFSLESFGAILEDDLELSDDFYRFVEYGKTFLHLNQDCLLVSGCRFSEPSDAWALTSYPLIWGWATSRRNWERMRAGLLTKPKKLISLNPRQNYWMVGSRRVHNGLIDTWDIPLVYFMLENNFTCLLPPVNLVKNIGFDNQAAHTKTQSFPLGLPHSVIHSSDLANVMLNNSIDEENHFLENNVYLIRRKHIFLSLYYLCTRLMQRPKYSRLRSRIFDI